MELLQLFDENQKMVDEYTKRKKPLELPSNRYIKVILLFIQNNEGKYLIQKTSIEKDSIFATTGGLVSYKDDDDVTVFKEADEELGLKLDKNKLVKIGCIKHPKAFEVIYYYQDNINIDDLVLQKEEVDYVTWLTKEEILELNNKDEFRKTNIPALELVEEWLKKKNNE